jgi:Arc/MetJ-type ribon-helix-helix transcriptional regulator
MTRKIGISLKDELYEWASGEVEEGRAESVSALIAEGLAILEARSRLEALVTDLRAEAGEPDEDARVRLAEALRAADEAYRKHLAARAADAA